MIPQIIFQTSLKKPEKCIIKLILSYCKGYEYKWFSDDDIICFFKDNPLAEFPEIINIFDSFSNGAHKADLFRYYFLYLKGGVYLDSDAILEVPIEEITKGYDFVSIKSYHKNQNLLFNGFLACEPGNQVIYEALKNIYLIKDTDLKKDYLMVCKNLYNICSKFYSENIKIYQEKKMNNFKAGVVSFSGNKKILTHYCYLKKIPCYENKLLFSLANFCFKFRVSYKLFKFFNK